MKVLGGSVREARWWAVLSLAAIWSLWSPAARASSNPVPYIDSVSPVATQTGGGSVSLTINGVNFVPGSSFVQVVLDGATTSTPLTTTVVSPTQLTATLPASETTKDATALVTVVNGKGLVSNVVDLPITHLASPTFRETTQAASGGNHPYTPPVVADFNNDGILDIAVSNDSGAGNYGVSVFLGKPGGSFQGAGAPWPTGNVPEGLAVGDFNNDGNQDLAVANNQDSSITILLGNGNGTFQPGQTTDLSSGQPYLVAAGDFNGDGILDVAVACIGTQGGSGFVTILLGNGDGTFVSNPASFGTISQPAGLAAADLDLNGTLDLAVTDSGSSEVWILSGNGDGTFSSGTHLSTQSGPGGVVAADLNNDGKPDLAVAYPLTNQLSVLINNNETHGTLAFMPHQEYATSGAGSFLAAADLNGDGVLDLAVPNAGSNDVSVLLGNGDGTFQSYTSFSVDPSFTSVVGIAPADFNADGRIDFAFTATEPQQGASPLSVVSVLLQAPEMTLPASLSFGNQLKGTQSAAQTVTLTNTGGAPLTFYTIKSTDQTDFPETNNCGTSLESGASCTVDVSFAPSASGSLSASLSIADNVTGISDPQLVSLSGISIVPAGLAPASLTFGNQLVGSTSAAQTLTFSNTNSVPLSITSIAVSNGFSETNTCGSSVTANLTCTINVSFAPTTSGTANGTLTVADNSGATSDSTQTVSLTGSGIAAAGLTPASVTFASQMVGTTSAAQTLTVSNSNSTALSISSITITGANSGDFSQTNTCGTSLAANANCTISVSFKPAATGTRTGTIMVAENASGAASSTQSVSLTGTGVTPVAAVAPGSLTFAGQLVASTSAAQVVTLSNTGTAALTVTSISASGDFTQTNNCGTSVAAGASCAINVTFAPANAGTLTGSVTITDNSSGVAASTQTVSLTGTGTAPGVTLSASSLSFGNENVGAQSAGQAVTVTNTGTATLTISNITAGGDFSQSNTCGASLSAGASCTATVTFKPTTIFSRSGTLTVTDNASSGAQTVSLSGTGVGADSNVSPSSLAFSGQLVGATSTAQVVTLKNVGNAAMTVADMAASGDFSETSTCGSSLAVNATCTISVTFKPTAGGTRTGALTFSADGSHSVGLSGAGQDFSFAGASTYSVSPGQSATYNLSATSEGGLSAAVALSCSGAPSEATCTVSPSSVTLNGSSATNFQVTVSTTAASALAPLSRMTPPSAGDRGTWLLLGLGLLAGMMLLARRRPEGMVGRLRLGLATAGMVLVLALGIVACGGGNSTTASSNPGTPTGKYSLTVTGTLTSGSVTVSHDVQVTLQVQ